MPQGKPPLRHIFKNTIIFESGGRSHWHTHGGMIILGTGGVGYYQEEGQPTQIIRKGDVIECAPGVKHWHGATADSWFSQMVIYDSHYEGGDGGEPEPVTDEYYAAYLHAASQWDGDYAPLAKQGIAVYIFMAERDEYCGSQKARDAYDSLYAAYALPGIASSDAYRKQRRISFATQDQ